MIHAGKVPGNLFKHLLYDVTESSWSRISLQDFPLTSHPQLIQLLAGHRFG